MVASVKGEPQPAIVIDQAVRIKRGMIEMIEAHGGNPQSVPQSEVAQSCLSGGIGNHERQDATKSPDLENSADCVTTKRASQMTMEPPFFLRTFTRKTTVRASLGRREGI
jgi:hypothetical protein